MVPPTAPPPPAQGLTPSTAQDSGHSGRALRGLMPTIISVTIPAGLISLTAAVLTCSLLPIISVPGSPRKRNLARRRRPNRMRKQVHFTQPLPSTPVPGGGMVTAVSAAQALGRVHQTPPLLLPRGRERGPAAQLRAASARSPDRWACSSLK